MTHVWRFMVFGLIGGAVFIFGTVLQAILLGAGFSSDLSYIWQTILSVLLSFFLNWQITWKDKDSPLVRSLVKWCLQKAVLNVPNVMLYDALVSHGMKWLIANVVATAAFTVVNYAAGHYWSFTPAKATRARVSLTGLAIAVVVLAIPASIAVFPQTRPLVYAAWMSPLLELVLLACGFLWFTHRFRESGRFERTIIQVTTNGNSPERVAEIVQQINDYHLDMRYGIWVVTEPEDPHYYPGAYTIKVPAGFTCVARRKGRALEYSRQRRAELGLDTDDVKLIFMDDDVTPTRAYIETAWRAAYDVCEGVVTPRTGYGFRPFGHFLASHADDIRTQACLVWCSVFQGIFRRPLHVHGEGLVMTGRAEAIVGWDRDCMSEDLSFGQTAVKAGLRWGWFHEYVEITSPWTLRDYMVQRRRWIWGDVQAVRSREVMGWGAAARVLLKYLQGVLVLSCSAVGLWLRLSGRIPATAGILNFGKLALIAWVALLFSCGWIAASTSHGRRSDDSRMLSGVLAVVMMPVSVLLTFAAILISLLQGDPGDFKTIRKTR